MSDASPVGKRPMIHPDDLKQIIDFTVNPLFDRHLPDGRVLRHIASTRSTPQTLYYRAPDGLSVHWGKIATSDHGYRRVLCASYPDRYPSWDEMHTLRDVFFPKDVDVMFPFPRASTPYINDHPFCFWLIETPTAWNWPEEEPKAWAERSGIRLLNTGDPS